LSSLEKLGTLIWDELVNLPTSDGFPELLGLFAALPHTRDRGDYLVSSPRLVVTRRLLKLWRGLNEGRFNATIGTADGSLELDRTHGKARFRIAASAFGDVLSERGSLGKKDQWAWLRGVWAGCGALYLPRSGYYMTFRLPVSGQVEPSLRKAFRKAGITAGDRLRQGRRELMLRDQGQIVTCLARMGLARSSLLLEETAIIRSLKSRANKLVNCDEANINKSLEAARQQLKIAEQIDARGLRDQLSPEFAELVRARMENPSASLRELGQILSRPVSKSTVEYRWRKLETLIRGDMT